MKKVASILATVGFVAGLTQFSFGQHGSLTLINQNSGINGDNGIYYAGSVNMTWTPDGGGQPQGIIAYCTTLNVEIGFGSTWGATQLDTSFFMPEPPSDTVATEARYAGLGENDFIVGGELAYIANTFGGVSDGSPAANFADAAAQFAIWDIALGYNGANNDGFLGTLAQDALIQQAEFDAQVAFNGGAFNLANDVWYKADFNTNGQPESQDFLVPNSTPEPFTMGIGAVGIGLALRRRMKRSA